jgi:hypothetical protein
VNYTVDLYMDTKAEDFSMVLSSAAGISFSCDNDPSGSINCQQDGYALGFNLPFPFSTTLTTKFKQLDPDVLFSDIFLVRVHPVVLTWPNVTISCQDVEVRFNSSTYAAAPYVFPALSGAMVVITVSKQPDNPLMWIGIHSPGAGDLVASNNDTFRFEFYALWNNSMIELCVIAFGRDYPDVSLSAYLQISSTPLPAITDIEMGQCGLLPEFSNSTLDYFSTCSTSVFNAQIGFEPGTNVTAVCADCSIVAGSYGNFAISLPPDRATEWVTFFSSLPLYNERGQNYTVQLVNISQLILSELSINHGVLSPQFSPDTSQYVLYASSHTVVFSAVAPAVDVIIESNIEVSVRARNLYPPRKANRLGPNRLATHPRANSQSRHRKQRKQ